MENGSNDSCIKLNTKMASEGDQDLQIEAQGLLQDSIGTRIYSIISFWKYESRAFHCSHAFDTPEIIPVEHASGNS